MISNKIDIIEVAKILRLIEEERNLRALFDEHVTGCMPGQQEAMKRTQEAYQTDQSTRQEQGN